MVGEAAEAGEVAAEYRAEFHAMLGAGVGAGPGPGVGLEFLKAQGSGSDWAAMVGTQHNAPHIIQFTVCNVVHPTLVS